MSNGDAGSEHRRAFSHVQKDAHAKYFPTSKLNYFAMHEHSVMIIAALLAGYAANCTDFMRAGQEYGAHLTSAPGP